MATKKIVKINDFIHDSDNWHVTIDSSHILSSLKHKTWKEKQVINGRLGVYSGHHGDTRSGQYIFNPLQDALDEGLAVEKRVI
jgi:hypothetical protein